MRADNYFISNYAKENPSREDISETLVIWFAVRFNPSSLGDAVVADLEKKFKNRFAVYDAQNWNTSPFSYEGQPEYKPEEPTVE
jgi:hypothetical protein